MTMTDPAWMQTERPDSDDVVITGEAFPDLDAWLMGIDDVIDAQRRVEVVRMEALGYDTADAWAMVEGER